MLRLLTKWLDSRHRPFRPTGSPNILRGGVRRGDSPLDVQSQATARILLQAWPRGLSDVAPDRAQGVITLVPAPGPLSIPYSANSAVTMPLSSGAGMEKPSRESTDFMLRFSQEVTAVSRVSFSAFPISTSRRSNSMPNPRPW